MGIVYVNGIPRKVAEATGKNYLSAWFDGSASVTYTTVTDIIDATVRSAPDIWATSSASFLTVTTTGTLPLEGLSSTQITHVATGAAFIETPLFAIDRIFLGKSIFISVDVSGVVTPDNWQLVVVRYDNTNTLKERIVVSGGTASATSPFSIQLPTGTEILRGFFTASSTITDKYALRFYRNSAVETANIKLDELYAGSSNQLTTLQGAYDNDTNGSNAIITTNATDGSVVIAGTQSLQVTATSGLYVSNSIGVGTPSPTSALSVGATSQFQVNSTGNIIRINDVTTSFPSSQGAVNTVLRNDGSGILSWTLPMVVGNTVTGATTGSVLFVGSSSVLQQDNTNFFWDDTNNRLGIGTATPTTPLQVVGSSTTAAITVTNSDTTGRGIFITHTGNGTTGRAIQVLQNGTATAVQIDRFNAVAAGRFALSAVTLDPGAGACAVQGQSLGSTALVSAVRGTLNDASIARSGTTANTFTSVTGLSQTQDIGVGYSVSGTGIQVGTTVTSIDSTTSLTLSLPATADGTVTLTFSYVGNGIATFGWNLATGATSKAIGFSNHATGSHVGFNAPASSFTSYALTFPSAQGGANKLLKNNGSGILSWTDAMVVGESITSATAGSVLFAGTSGVLAQDNANFFWDDTNDRLGIGTASPAGPLDVRPSSGAFVGPIFRVSSNGGVEAFKVASNTESVFTSGSVNGSSTFITINPGANTNVNSDSTSLRVNANILSLLAGYATQRFNTFSQSTITSGTAQTVVEAATVSITGAPVAAGSAAITSSIGLRIASAASVAAGTTNAYGLYVDVPTGATNNYAVAFATGNVGIGTTAPASKLTISDTAAVDTVSITHSATSARGIVLSMSSASNSANALHITHAGAGTAIRAQVTGAGTGLYATSGDVGIIAETTSVGSSPSISSFSSTGRHLKMFDAGGSSAITFRVPASVTNHELTFPSANPTPASYLRNDGTGALTWSIGTLQQAYDDDPNGSGATITTNATDGFVIIAGTEGLQVTGNKGLTVSPASPGGNSALTVTYNGTNAAVFIDCNGSSSNPALKIDQATADITAPGIQVYMEPSSTGTGVYVPVDGAGRAFDALMTSTNTTDGIRILHGGTNATSTAGRFSMTSASAAGDAVVINHAGTGRGLHLSYTNAASSTTGLNVAYGGQGIAVNVVSSVGVNPALAVSNNGGDIAIQASTAGSTGKALNVSAANNNAASFLNASVVSQTLTIRNSNTSGNILSLLGATTGGISVKVPNSITNHTLTLPSAQGAVDTVMRNDGSGNLTWVAANSLTTLQNVYDNDTNGSNAIITTNSTDGSVIIAGTEQFRVTATNGAIIQPSSGSVTALTVIAQSGAHCSEFTATGTAIAALYTSDGTTQPTAYFKNTNSGTGGNIWLVNTGNNRTNLKVSASQATNIDWVFPITQGASDSVLRNDGSGSLSWVAANSFTTLQNAYNNDVNGSDATITTNATDGYVVVAGTEGLRVTGSRGLVVAASATATGDLITVPAVGDIYATGRLEVDGAARFDSTITAAANINVASTFGLESTTASSTLNVGSSGNTTILNLGTGSNANTINVGTGAGTTTINIGGSGDTVNVAGTLTYVNTTNLEVTDKLITINKGGATSSGNASGIAVEENGILEGYAYVGNSRQSWDFIAPASNGTFRLTPHATNISEINTAALTTNRTYTLPDESGVLWVGNIFITELSDVDDSIAASTNDIFYYDGSEWTNTTLPVLANSVLSISNLSDVGTLAPSTNDIFYYTGSEWNRTTLPVLANSVLSISNLSDVGTLAPSTNDIFYYTGSEWNTTDAPVLDALEVTTTVARGASGAQVEEEYIHSITLTASQVNAVAAALTFDAATFEGCIIQYKIKEATSNLVRVGQLYVSNDGTTVDIVDTYGATGDVGVTWTAAINGLDVELKYTTTANNKTMRADVKRIPA